MSLARILLPVLATVCRVVKGDLLLFHALLAKKSLVMNG